MDQPLGFVKKIIMDVVRLTFNMANLPTQQMRQILVDPACGHPFGELLRLQGAGSSPCAESSCMGASNKPSV
jgi:hypothetical protein